MKTDEKLYVADRIRRALTDASIDLRMSPKSKIEAVIIAALEQAQRSWPALERERRERALTPE